MQKFFKLISEVKSANSFEDQASLTVKGQQLILVSSREMVSEAKADLTLGL